MTAVLSVDQDQTEHRAYSLYSICFQFLILTQGILFSGFLMEDAFDFPVSNIQVISRDIYYIIDLTDIYIIADI